MRTSTLMLVAAGLALIGGDLGAGAAPSSLRGRIAFSTTSVSYYGSGDLFLAGAGRRRRNLTRSADRDESAPALSPDETMLAFAGASRGRSDIYVRSLAGATVRNVTNDPEEDRLPTWSPDGTMLAFARGRLGEQELWVIGADGQGAHRVSTRTTELLTPSWSPDGARLVFLKSRQVHVVDAAGGNERRVSDDPRVSGAFAALWRLDGRIAVVVERGGAKRWKLYTMTAAGADIREEAHPCRGDELPTWSIGERYAVCLESDRLARVVTSDGRESRRVELLPRNQSVSVDEAAVTADGRRLFYAASIDEKDADLAVMDPDGRNSRVLIVSPQEEFDPAVSPDGRRIAFVRGPYQDVDRDGQLLVLAVASRRIRPLAPRLRGASPTWSPDGHRVAFSRAGDLFVLDVLRGRVRRLTRGPETDRQPTWSPVRAEIAFVRGSKLEVIAAAGGSTRRLATGTELGDPSWSPSGNRVAYVSAGERILTVARTGGRPRVVHRDRDNPITSPTWSPDGTRIAFAKGWTNDIPYPFDVPRAEFLAIYLVPAAGGAARTVRAVAGWDLEPDWARR